MEADVQRLIDLSEQTPELFPEILQIKEHERIAHQREIEQTISRSDIALNFFNGLESEDPQFPLPRITDAPLAWAHIRWTQVSMLFATDLFLRYGGKLRGSLTPNVLLKLEHDAHDAQVLVLAVLEGAIATNEKKLLRWFSLLTNVNPGLRPDA